MGQGYVSRREREARRAWWAAIVETAAIYGLVLLGGAWACGALGSAAWTVWRAVRW